MRHPLALDHPASTLAALLGVPAPACDGVVLRHGDAPEVLACRVDANPLLEDVEREEVQLTDIPSDAAGGARIDPSGDGAWIFDPGLPSTARPRLLSWSGTLAPGLFDATPRNWTQRGRQAFDAFCDRVRPAFERHEWSLCFHPHARHVLSDTKGCRDFLARRSGQPFEIALAPASMLEASMLDRAAEHLERLFAGLGGLAALVILEDLRPPQEDGAALERVALGDGVLPAAAVRDLLREHVPATTPVVVRASRIEAQRAWLAG